MTSAIIKGGLLGGLIAFVWSAISWMVLPWHTSSMHNFTNEDAVIQVLQENAPEPGVYSIPGVQNTGKTPEEKKACEEGMMKRMETGPFLYTSYRTEGMSAMWTPYLFQFIAQIVAGMFITWLVLKLAGHTYMGRVMAVAMIVLIGGLLYELPMSFFWHFPAGHTIVNIVDLLVGWFLAGLVIAKFTAPRVPARV